MKRLHTGVIILDVVDIVCISFSAGSMLAYGYKKYRNYRRIKITGKDPIIDELKKKSAKDPIVDELKKKSGIQLFSKKGNPLKLPLVRGGDTIARGYSLIIKNKKLATILRAIVHAKKRQKNLRFLQNCLIILNGLLTTTTGFSIAAGGSLSYVQIIFMVFPSTIGGFLVGAIADHPVAISLLPMAILVGRDIEDVPDPYEKCRILCKVAEEYHNKELMLQMKNLRSLVEEASDSLQLPLDEVHLLCTEEKLSLLERFKLKEVIRSEKARKRIQHFREFIKKFPECDADPDTVFEQIMGTSKRISVKND